MTQDREQSPFAHIGDVLGANILLVIAGCAWWGSHFLKIYNTHISVQVSFIPEYNTLWMPSVALTVLTLGIIATYTYKHPEFRLCSSRIFFVACALLLGGSFVLFALPGTLGANAALASVGSVISGIGNSFAIIMMGELHLRMGARYIPIACAIECAFGILLYLAFSSLPLPVMTVAALVLVGIAARCFFLYSRKPEPRSYAIDGLVVDVSLNKVLIIAALTGFAYGLCRAFGAALPSQAGFLSGTTAELIGSCLGIALLVLVFCLQKRLTLLEQCFLFVAPIVAAGMLLLSLQEANALPPTVIAMSGFVCFFEMMWYLAAVLAAKSNPKRMPFLVAILFFCSQATQFLGSCIPVQFLNTLSSALVYLLLIAAVFFMYWQSKGKMQPQGARGSAIPISAKANDAQVNDAFVLAPSLFEPVSPSDAERALWSERFGFSSRETEIACLLIRRTPYKQIGAELFVSDNTVKTHVRNIYKKAGVTSREELLEKVSSFTHNS